MHSIEELIDLLKNRTGCDKVEATSDIFAALGCCVDDFDELIDKFEKFNVEMTSLCLVFSYWRITSREAGTVSADYSFKHQMKESIPKV